MGKRDHGAPAGFDAYVRVLHPASDVEERAWRWRDVAAVTGRSVHPLVQWWRLVDAEIPHDPVSELWGGYPPEDGALSEPDRGTLLVILGAHTQTPDEVIFGVWAGYASLNPNGSKLFTLGKHGYSHTEHVEPTAMAARLAAGPRLRHPGRDYVLMRGALTEADMIPALLDDYGPTLWANLVWPDDRAWCVGSEIDFDSTLVACSDETATAIVSNDLLEAFLVRPDDSLQFDADVINGRR